MFLPNWGAGIEIEIEVEAAVEIGGGGCSLKLFRRAAASHPSPCLAAQRLLIPHPVSPRSGASPLPRPSREFLLETHTALEPEFLPHGRPHGVEVALAATEDVCAV